MALSAITAIVLLSVVGQAGLYNGTPRPFKSKYAAKELPAKGWEISLQSKGKHGSLMSCIFVPSLITIRRYAPNPKPKPLTSKTLSPKYPFLNVPRLCLGNFRASHAVN